MIYFNCPEKSLLPDSALSKHSIFSREARQAKACSEHRKGDSAAASALECEAPAVRISHRQGSLRHAHKSIFLCWSDRYASSRRAPLPPLRGKVSREARRMRGRAVRRNVGISTLRTGYRQYTRQNPVNAEATRLVARPLIRPAPPATFPRKGGRGRPVLEMYAYRSQGSGEARRRRTVARPTRAASQQRDAASASCFAAPKPIKARRRNVSPR